MIPQPTFQTGWVNNTEGNNICYVTLSTAQGLAAKRLAPAVATEDDLRGSIVLFLPLGYLAGSLLITIISLWNWRDLTRWFPAR